MYLLVSFTLLMLKLLVADAQESEGYVAYCPCMGK